MLRLVGVLAVLASGCRIAFDDVTVDGATSDGPGGDVLLGHDEDGDGISDSADFCPHIVDPTNLDTDGDLVGDVCDREPTLARQTWDFFSPMTTGTLPSFGIGPAGAWTMNADDWHYDDATQQAQLLRDTGSVGNVDAWVGLDVEALGAGGIQAAIITNGLSVPYWYGELYDDAQNGARISIAEYTGTSYVARTQTSMGPTFPLGATDLYLSARIGDGYTLSAGGQTTTFLTPGYSGQRFLIFAFGNHSGRVRYIAIVTSQ